MNITVMTGSVRPNSVGKKILPIIIDELKNKGANVTVADVKEMNLPFVDSLVSPMTEGFKPEHESVKAWQKTVESSDAMLMIVPEYNNQPTAVQKNAIDWLFASWKDLPVAIVSYGWGGGEQSAALIDKLLHKVEASPIETRTSLFFTKDLSLEGDVINDEVPAKIEQTIDALLEVAKKKA